MYQPNEDRADNGESAILASAARDLANESDYRTAVTDCIAYLLHAANRHGEARTADELEVLLDDARRCYEGDFEDGPMAIDQTAIEPRDMHGRRMLATYLRASDWDSVADDVDENVPLATILERLREIGEGESMAAKMIEAAPITVR